MNPFDGSRKRDNPPAAATAAQQFGVVPDGYRLDMYRALPWPGVTSSAAGVWIAHHGVSSDEPEEDLDRVICQLEVLLAGPRPQIRFYNARAPISALMSPARPVETLKSGHLIWTFDAAAIARAQRAPELVQRMIRCMYLTSRAAISQSAFAINANTAPARALLALIRELRITVRERETEDWNVLAEVHRPEGYIVCGLLGASLSNASVAGSWAREVNDEKNRAAGDRERQTRLEEEERRALEQRLSPGAGARPIAAVDRAPRLRRLMLDVAEKRGATAKQALIEELLVREIPLLVTLDPTTKAARLRAWPGGYQALEVFGDNASWLATVKERGLTGTSIAAGVMLPATLFAWAASLHWAVALCTFLPSGKLAHVHLRAVEVHELAAARRANSS
jgi:hypothetical protein